MATVRSLLECAERAAKGGKKGVHPIYLQRMIESHEYKDDDSALEFLDDLRDVKAFLAAARMPPGWPSPRTVGWACSTLSSLLQMDEVRAVVDGSWKSEVFDDIVDALGAEQARLKGDVQQRKQRGLRGESSGDDDSLADNFDEIMAGNMISRSAAIFTARWAVHMLAKTDPKVYHTVIAMLADDADAVPPELKKLLLKLLKKSSP